MGILQTVRNASGGEIESRRAGADFIQYAKALMVAGRDGLPGALMAAQSNRATDRVVDVLRAAVAAGTTTDAQWAKPLISYQQISNGFLESLKAASAFQSILSDAGFRIVPFKSQLGVIMTGATASRVNELAPTPVTRLSLSGELLDEVIRVATIIVVSNELARLSGPVGSTLIGNELRSAVAVATDKYFFLELLSTGTPSVPSSGASAADAWSDIGFLLASVPLTASSSPFFVAGSLAARSLATRTTAGASAFPDAGPMGGTVVGIPLLVSDGIDEDSLVLLDGNRIAVADGGVTLDTSEHANVALSDNGAGAQSSLWQGNMTGIKCERLFSMQPLGDNAVAYVSGVGGT